MLCFKVCLTLDTSIYTHHTALKSVHDSFIRQLHTSWVLSSPIKIKRHRHKDSPHSFRKLVCHDGGGPEASGVPRHVIRISTEHTPKKITPYKRPLKSIIHGLPVGVG